MVSVADRRVSVWQNKIRPNIKVVGNGPPLVFLHGAGGVVWDQFLAELAASHTVYAPEHPEFNDGEEEAISDLDNLWDLVHYYHEIFEALDLKSVPVIGHAFGAMIAAELAANSPERVSKLILMCPVGLWRDDAPIPNWMLVTPSSDLSKNFMHDPEGDLAQEMFTLPDTELQLRMIWSVAGSAKFGWPVPDSGLKRRIHSIQAPTMVLWGKQDRLVPVRYAEEFGRRIPGAKVTVLDCAGHLFPAEYPARVARMVEDFLG